MYWGRLYFLNFLYHHANKCQGFLQSFPTGYADSKGKTHELAALQMIMSEQLIVRVAYKQNGGDTDWGKWCEYLLGPFLPYGSPYTDASSQNISPLTFPGTF